MARKCILFSLVFVAAALCCLQLANAQKGYCNIQTCERPSQHTMCKYPSSQPAKKCMQRGGQQSGLTSAEKQAIVDKHNEYRRLVARGGERRGSPGPQPAARSMPDLKWDDELAMIAQRWADQCDYDHDDCGDTSRFQVGQNIAISSTTGNPASISLLGMIDKWYGEVKDFDRSVVSGYRRTGKKVGHYTQMVWDTTTLVGCGVRNYFEDGWNNKYLVCNYGPTGNIRNFPVYRTA